VKIAFFVHRFYPHVGGVEKYVHELARALLQLGHQVVVVAGKHLPNLPERDEYEGIAIRRFPALRSPLRCRLWLWRNVSLFTGADVVQVSNTHMLELFWRMLCPLVDARKVFLMRHGTACVYPLPDHHRTRAQRAQGLAAGVVHDGRFIEKWLDVVPDLCPDQGLRPRAEELAPVAEPPPHRAVYVGRLEPDTGIQTYVEAVALLNRKRLVNRGGANGFSEHPGPFELDVCGDGSLMSELRSRVARESLPVRLYGWVPDAQRRISEACFALVDGRMAIQEAMARRRLVIAAYHHPLKRDYICGESYSPHLVAVGSAEEAARALQRFAAHREERQAIVERAWHYTCNLDWQRTARSFLDLWEHRLSLPRVARRRRWAMPRLPVVSQATGAAG